MELIGNIIMKFLSYIIPFVLRWYYTRKKLAEMMRITINSEHDGLVVNCGEIPDARIWMEVANQSPFPVEIQGISVNLIWGGTVGRFISIERSEIKPHSFERILVETTLTGEQAAYIRENHSKNKPRLSVLLELKNRIRSFSVCRQEISTTNIKLNNCGEL